MTLSINDTYTVINISSSFLDLFIGTPASYTKLEVIGELNCSGTTTTKTYTAASPITGSTDVRTSGGVETIVPNFFGLTTFADGIYKFTLQLTTLSGTSSTDVSCVFSDVTTKCNIPQDCLEKQMLHYTLGQSQGCGCDCAKLCEIYDLINDTTTENGCGCS